MLILLLIIIAPFIVFYIKKRKHGVYLLKDDGSQIIGFKKTNAFGITVARYEPPFYTQWVELLSDGTCPKSSTYPYRSFIKWKDCKPSKNKQ